MEKSEITLSFDSEKMEALVFYLKKENTSVQKKMDEALRLLYEQTVPEPLREYLDAKSAPARPKRPPRPSQSRVIHTPCTPLASSTWRWKPPPPPCAGSGSLLSWGTSSPSTGWASCC